MTRKGFTEHVKSPLSYQCTEFDCGPTTILNALSFLFTREEIPPEVVRHVMLYTLDAYDKKGEAGRRGTSTMAMQFLASWLNHFGVVKKFPLACERLVGQEVHVGRYGRLESCLRDGGAAIVKVRLGVWHYVLFTGIEEDWVYLFDPYFRNRPFRNSRIILLNQDPFTANRKVNRDVFSQPAMGPYTLGPAEERECVLIFNTSRQRPAPEIEYMI